MSELMVNHEGELSDRIFLFATSATEPPDIDYLRSRAGQIEKEQPAAYRAFLDQAAAKRAALERDPAHKGAAKKIYLRLFDDEQSHLERFRDFFGEPSFEDWCKGTKQ